MDNKQVTAEWIAKQRALCEAATRGPWKSSDVRLDGMPVVFCENRRIFDAVVKDGQSAVDADFIASARTALPAALDALEAAYAEIERLTHDYAASAKRLIDEKDRLTAERDAALRDLKHMDNCDICAHGQAEVLGCDVECMDCKLDCTCRDCRNEDKWQWRGVCDENGGEEDGNKN